MSNRRLTVTILFVSMLWASMAGAQTPVLNPHFLEFNASADHNATGSSGQALVVSYDLEFYNIGAASPFQTNSLGKPAPNTSGVIRIDMSATFAALPVGTTYEARVAAVGPGGVGRSAVSNQFAFTNLCALTLSPTGTSAGSAASTGSVAVTTGAGCAWTATSNASWVTISSGASGSGNGAVNYSIAANTAATPRTAALTIGGQTFNISQAAGCTFTISPTSLSVTSGARTGTVAVTSATGCAWTAASSASWITVTSGANGSGTGSVGYSIAANPTITPRTGVVTIAGQAFTVTQDGIPCTSTISPTGVSLDAAAATGSIAVSIPAGCTWTATDSASWVSITSGASGTGNGTVGYSITANPNTTPRTATISVAGQSFDITQAGVVCSTTISPTASSPTAAGGSSTVAVTANAGSCAWTATSNASWITITAGANGSGSGNVSYNVAPNTVTSSRTGTMTIAGQTMTVTQAAAPCNYGISPTVASLGPQVSTNSVAVTAAAGCAWTATESASWITINSGASGSGDGTVSYSVTANPTITPRSAVMTIAGQSFDVTQSGQSCNYSVTPAGVSVPAAGSTGTFDVAALGGCTWTATSSAPWLTVTSGGSGSGNGTVGYSAAANTVTSPRTGTITVGGQAFTVTQAAAACTYAASPATQSFVAGGGPGTVTLTTQAGCAWTATTSAPWITIGGGGTGTGPSAINYTVGVNPNSATRSGTIAVGGQIVTVSQDAAPCNYALSPASISVGSDAASGTFSMTATSGCSWTATSAAPWLTITSAASGSGNGSLAYSVAANPNTTQRTGTISAGGQTFTVTQAAVVCTLAISPTASSPTAAGGAGAVSVTANAGACAWTAASNASWITVTAGANGSGNGTVSYNVAANASTTGRTGTMTIAGQTMTVTQAGAPCNYAISPTVASLGPAGSTNTVAVTASSGCAWVTTENASWITITGNASGSGNGTVTYTVTANPAITARNAVITIAGQSFDVTQAGQTCTYTLTPPGASVPAATTSGTVDVAALAGCAWNASSAASWVTLTSAPSGSGNGTVSYSVAANGTTSPRTGTLTIGGQPFTITQAGGSCTYSVSPATPSFGASGGPGTVTLTTQAGCAWNATTGASWVTIAGTGAGTGSGTIDYTVATNASASSRSGTIAVGGQVVTISQAAAPCTYTVAPSSISVGSDAATGNFSIAATAGCSWSATSAAPWLTMTSSPTGSGNGTIAYSVAANPNTSSRTGTISVGGQSFTVTQAAVVCTLAISPTASSPTAAGGAGTVSVTANAGSCAWTAASNAPWITVTAGTSGTGNGTVAYSVGANTSMSSRTGTLTIGAQTFTVTQAGAPCNYAISPTVASLGPSASTNTIVVSAVSGCAWTTAESASWITITGGASGLGDGTVTYSVTANTTTTPRSATITVAGQSFDVTQNGQSCSYALTPAGASVPAAATSGSVGVTASGGCAWTATAADSWITITSGASGTGDGTVAYAVAANTAASPRTGTLTIGGQPFTITQGAATCSYAVSPATQSFTAAGGPGAATIATQGGCAWTATTSAPWITINGTGTGAGSGTVNYSVGQNPDGFGRSGTIAVGAQIVTVSQAAATCTFTLSPSGVSVGSDVSAGSFSVAANNGCAWTATSSAAWLTITSAPSGSGDGTVNYSVAANSTTAARTATITVGGRAFSVTQAAPACTFTLSSTSLSVAASASPGSISVTSVTGCSWTAASADSWITVTGGATGSGTGTVSLSIAANTASTSRTGTLTIAGQTVTVTQAGVACTTAISPQSVFAPPTSTNGSVSVTAAAGCAWTAISNAPWITVNSGTSGTGAGTVAYTIAANPGTTIRTGSMTIAGKTFNVSQSGPSCTVGFNPISASIASSGGAYTVDVTTGAGCNWTATTSQPWIAILSGGSGTGSGTIGFNVDANLGAFLRSASISINGTIFNITQAGACIYSMSPLSVSAAANATTTSVFVFTSTGCGWTAVSNSAWLTITGGTSGSGSGTVTLSATANNSGTARAGTATIAGQVFTLNQSGCSYSLSPTTVTVSANGSTSNALVSTTSGCSWTASSSDSWITMPAGPSGSGTSWLQYAVAPNPDPTPRSATITLAGRTMTINQNAAPCTFEVNPVDASLPKEGATATVTVTTAGSCAWTIQNSLNWVTVTGGTGGTGDGTVTLQVAANPLTYSRAAALYIAGEMVVIHQTGVPAAPPVPGNFRIVP